MFTKCPIPSTNFKNVDFSNHPINLAVCPSVKKSKSDFPLGGTLYKIEFEGSATTWKFAYEADRDRVFDHLVNGTLDKFYKV